MFHYSTDHVDRFRGLREKVLISYDYKCHQRFFCRGAVLCARTNMARNDNNHTCIDLRKKKGLKSE